VSIAIASRNTVGGATAAARNVISGNGQYGVQIAGTSSNQNVIAGNYIGTDATGAAKLGNTRYGVYLAAANNRIGGSAAGEGNVISGNGQGGIYLAGAGTTGNLIQGNRIGTNAAGTAALGNTSVGIDLRAPQTTIGGAAAGAGNLISGNRAAGIQVFGADATLNQIQGNRIGTDVTGMVDLGNSGAGVSIASGASGNAVGGTAAGAGNVIMGNTRGIIVAGTGTLRNAIRQNAISQNTALGVDLNGDNFTANDADDPDEGPNRLQNFPVVETAVLSGSTLTIHYGVPSVSPHSTFPLAVEFFLADADHQEGQRYLGGESYPASEPDSVVLTVSDISVGQRIVATATDLNGNTSEFSTSVTIAAALLAASLGAGHPVVDTLSGEDLQPVVWEAIAVWQSAGLDEARLTTLRSLTFEVRDLPGAYLGLATTDAITIDADAAGYGWQTNRAALDAPSQPSSLSLDPSSLDLLTAVLHEMGHVLGLDHDQDDLMADILLPGQRRLPTLSDIDEVLACGEWLEGR
jgi:parallel beta-helix repeat protein